MQYDTIYNLFKLFPYIQTDTRLLKKDEIFFALKGPNFNGNQFAAKAIELGAAAVVVDEETGIKDPKIILVENALTALQELAVYHRKQFKIPFIAITGSNGKTTTKELVHAVLSTTFKTYTTKGNLNNHIGIPLTILSIKEDAEMAVIEMGANHQKEIEGYCKIALPTHGIINNCGKAHMEGFGGVEGVRKGKGELYDYLSNENGLAFVNSDLDYLVQMSEKIKQFVFYGNERGNHQIRAIKKEPFLKLEFKDPELGTQFFDTNLVGEYNCPNIDAAITVGLHFGISVEKIKNAIAAYHPDNARSQLIQKGTNKIILDAYNANPTSMKLAIENIASMKAEKKLLFLGGMMELGDYSIQEHADIVDLLLKLNLHNVVLVGGDFENTIHPFTFFKTAAEAENWVKENSPNNSLILIKGSRSVKMEKILEFF
jgi:UDP-N-acetylmuramoyl-tripeptide--D-alanyl-D-alanine ligase